MRGDGDSRNQKPSYRQEGSLRLSGLEKSGPFVMWITCLTVL